MARKPALRAVTESDAPPPKLDVAEAAASGDHRALLVAMRDRIAQTVRNPECPPRDLAALTKRLADLAQEIRALDLADEQEARERGNVEDEAFDPSAI